jgi:drug/metabolite transporter (DMT)-like permease
LTPGAANALLLLAAAFWGFGNVAQKTVLDHLDPFGAVGLRCLIGALLVAPFAMRGLRTLTHSGRSSLIRVSLLFSIGIALQQYAFLETSVTNASFLISTATVMTPVAAWAMLGQRPGRLVMLAAAGTLAGILLKTGKPEHAGMGDLYALLSAAVYAVWMIELGRHMQAHGDAWLTAFAQFLLAAALTLPLGVAEGSLSAGAVLAEAPELAVLGIFSTAVAFGLQIVAQRHTSASHAVVIVSAESVFAAMGGALFLGERLSATSTIGAAIVLTAVLLLAMRGTERACANPHRDLERIDPHSIGDRP